MAVGCCWPSTSHPTPIQSSIDYIDWFNGKITGKSHDHGKIDLVGFRLYTRLSLKKSQVNPLKYNYSKIPLNNHCSSFFYGFPMVFLRMKVVNPSKSPSKSPIRQDAGAARLSSTFTSDTHGCTGRGLEKLWPSMCGVASC